MEFGAAILGGLVGGIAMVAVLYPMIYMFRQQMKMDFLKIVGMMFVPAGAAAYAMGFAVHMMMSAVFGLAHGAVLEAAAVESAAAGAAFGALGGIVHALIAGGLLGTMPLMHPRMRPEQPKLVPAMGPMAPAPDEELLDPPGFFGANYPAMTVMGFFALHGMFGVIVGLFYGGFA